MLQVAMDRLRSVLPSCVLRVITREPEVLLRHCPGVLPVPIGGRNQWLRLNDPPGWLFGIRDAATPCPRRASRLWQLPLLLWPGRYGLVKRFGRALFTADLLFVSGGATLTDAFDHNARRVLSTLELAHARGIPSCMAGQAIGPMANPALRAHSARVLPKVGRIFLRENVHGPNWLRQAGVAPQVIEVTGDDSIDLAYTQTTSEPGQAIGVNLRLASYASVPRRLLKSIRDLLVEKAQIWSAPLVGIPILHETMGPSDIRSLEAIFGVWLRGECGRDLQTPVDVIRRCGEARVVLSGSYHAAVFSLAQGIPAVCLASSPYYECKFEGLKQQFGLGCEVIRVREGNTIRRLSKALARLWREAPNLRPALLAAARSQIAAGAAAYRSIPDLLSSCNKTSTVQPVLLQLQSLPAANPVMPFPLPAQPAPQAPPLAS
jgi:colanic acid/amylovoran biosynthesis protein